MGKKTKNKQKKMAGVQFTPAVYSNSKPIVSDLLNLCLQETPTTGKLISYFEQLHGLTSSLIALQKEFHFTNSLSVPQCDRLDRLNLLLNHLTGGETAPRSWSVSYFENEGFGLKADDDIEQNSLLLEVPISEFLSTQEATKNIGTFLLSNAMTAQMPNVSLALYLLSELAAGKESKWFYYINSLPSVYETALYLNPEDLTFLKGSPSLELVVNTYRNICRQYASLFRLMEHSTNSDCLRFKNAFCFEDYRWACSTVMSRNNPVPVSQGSSQLAGDLALIPIWDLINHKQGRSTTDFDTESGGIKFYAMESCQKDSQIFMHYGNRSNAEFFTFAGFVDSECLHDKVPVKLGISQNDREFHSKEYVLQLLGLKTCEVFHISRKCPLPLEMLVFARIFSMKQDNLLILANDPDKIKTLWSKDCAVLTEEGELAAINFLRVRLNLLMSAYHDKTKVPDTTPELSSAQKRCISLCDTEKVLLSLALKELETFAVN